MITGSGLTVSEIENLIEEWIFSERDRFILKRLLLDAMMTEEEAQEPKEIQEADIPQAEATLDM